MDTRVDEIAADVYRLSTYIPEADFQFNQFLLNADEPLLFHTGPRRLFPLVSEAISRVRPVADLRWITFGHHEADENGSMNDFLAAAPNAQVAHGQIGCMTSTEDLADRPPRPLQDGEVLDLGGHRVRYLATPHVPHGWDSGVLFDETTSTLLCGDLLTSVGASDPLVETDRVGPASAAEEMFLATSLTPMTAPTLERLAELSPTTLAIMHGPSFSGNCAGQLSGMADYYRGRLAA